MTTWADLSHDDVTRERLAGDLRLNQQASYSICCARNPALNLCALP